MTKNILNGRTFDFHYEVNDVDFLIAPVNNLNC